MAKAQSLPFWAILMLILMVILLIFILLSLSGFFKAKTSAFYYNQFTSFIGSACYNPQSTTSFVLNNPNAIIFQIYDNSTCDALLSSANFFDRSNPYSSSLSSKYDVCFAETGLARNGIGIIGFGSTQDYYSTQFSGTQSTVYFSGFNSMYVSPLGMYASKDIVSAGTGQGVEQFTGNINQTRLRTFDINLDTYQQYASGSGSPDFNVQVVFYDDVNGYSCYTYTQNNNGNQQSLSISLSGSSIAQNCNGIGSAYVTFSAAAGSPSSTVWVFGNLSFVPSSNVAVSTLAQQCLDIQKDVNGGLLVNGTLQCQPVECSNSNFVLTDQENRPFLAISQEGFDYIGIEPGSTGALQIVNSNTENLKSSPTV